VDIAFAAIDFVVIVAAYSIGLGLRMLDPLVGNPGEFWLELLIALPFIALIHLTANALAGAYGHVWEYASLSEAVRLMIANGAASAVVLSLALLVRGPLGLVVPVGTLVMGSLLSLLLMGLVRFRSRLFSHRKHLDGPRIVVIGSGQDAVAFARRAHEIDGGGRVVGFVSDGLGVTSSSRLLADLPILGGLGDLGKIVTGEAVDQVVVVGADPTLNKAVVDACLDVEVRLRIIPAVEQVLRDQKAPLDLRDIQVEDLLLRDPVATDMTAVGSLLKDKRVLVTGAGGSIGSEIVRQVLGYEPAAVWALDRDETLLHESNLMWGGAATPLLADVREAATVLRAFERLRPEVVFHAAALKHVPVLEDYPHEAVLTNVVGTRNVIEAGSRTGVESFVLISTDKAVDPTSVMGATKRIAELLVKAGNERQDSCLYTAVRFGNVLGSRGSVIPTFVSQIRSGGPVTVTDPQMTRYFMTVDEAVQLVLQAAALARDSEVFLLDMGDPVRIEDLARRLIRLAGLIPNEDIRVEFTGMRPGEKLSETLANGPVNMTDHPKIFEVPLAHPGAGTLADAVAELEEYALSEDTDHLLPLLSSLAQGTLARRTQVMDDRIIESSASWS
jgi:FlaA1/EpsC-like NDP-sugar epimerase